MSQKKKTLWFLSGLAIFSIVITSMLLMPEEWTKSAQMDAKSPRPVADRTAAHIRPAVAIKIAVENKTTVKKSTAAAEMEKKPEERNTQTADSGSKLFANNKTNKNKKNEQTKALPKYDATVYQYTLSAPTALGTSLAQWKTSRISVSAVLEKRKKIAKGEKLYVRHTRRPDDPISYQRKRREQREIKNQL